METLSRPDRRLPPSLPKGTLVLKKPGRPGVVKGRSTPSNFIPDLSRLLARKAPAPPIRATSTARTLHPFPDPPPLNLASKPISFHDQTAVHHPDVRSCLQCRDFSRVDAHAALFSRSSVRSLEDLAYDLAEPFQDEVDKARAIFAWLHYNISYDAESFFSGNVQSSTPDSTLSSGVAVCEGYARLFEHLGTLMNLLVHTVSGHGKGYGYQALSSKEPVPEMASNHAWNCVLLCNEWHLVDSCWGAGFLNGTVYQPKLASKWFIAPPIEFGQRHFPKDESFLLTDKLYTWADYILAPEGPKLTIEFDQSGLHPTCVEPSTKEISSGQFVRFSVRKRCEHLSVAEMDNYVFVISNTTQDYFALEYSCQESAWIADIFISGGGDITLYSVDKVEGYDAKGLDVKSFNQAKGRKAMTFKGLAMWTAIHL